MKNLAQVISRYAFFLRHFLQKGEAVSEGDLFVC
jgi:hypothetical protein